MCACTPVSDPFEYAYTMLIQYVKRVCVCVCFHKSMLQFLHVLSLVLGLDTL